MKNFFFFNEKKNYFTKKVFRKTHKCLNTNKKNKNNFKKNTRQHDKKKEKILSNQIEDKKNVWLRADFTKKKIIKRAREREIERE